MKKKKPQKVRASGVVSAAVQFVKSRIGPKPIPDPPPEPANKNEHLFI
jgi:hypothetical protein